MIEPNRITSFIKNNDIYYTIPWTPLKKADRYEIARGLPALPGIFQIFWEDEKKKLHMLTLEQAWFGGVRSKIREKIDPDLEDNAERKKILADKVLYYRYVLTDSWTEIQDIMFFFLTKYRKTGLSGLKSSGRYEKIFLRENPAVS